MMDMYLGYTADKWQNALDWAKENNPDLVFAENGASAIRGAWDSIYSGTEDRRSKQALDLWRDYELALFDDYEIWNCR